jgi:hypothetical protein
MAAGMKANPDGSAAIQVGGTDYINISSAGAVSIPQTLAVTGATTFAAGSASTPSIAFTGDTNTGIYSSGADAVDIATGGTQRGQFDASGNFLFNSGYGSVATAYGCRAWVNFNGTTNVGGFCTIRASGNVSTVADNGTGDYTVNFATAMPDANYSVSGSAVLLSTVALPRVMAPRSSADIVSGSVRIRTSNDAGGLDNCDTVSVAVFR